MLTMLDPALPDQDFPPVDQALPDPNGLLALGGDLSPDRLLKAYRQGIFPWYNEGEPILWWSPDPRLVLFPDKIKVSRSLRKILKQGKFQVTFDQVFTDVIEGCAQPHTGNDGDGTWITPPMKEAYIRLHQLGHAHSVEAWQDNELAGGLYGVAIGRVFYGESMFYRRSNASKVAFVTLVAALKSWNYALIDCQVHTSHLASFGAETIPRKRFTALLKSLCKELPNPMAWTIKKADRNNPTGF